MNFGHRETQCAASSLITEAVGTSTDDEGIKRSSLFMHQYVFSSAVYDFFFFNNSKNVFSAFGTWDVSILMHY